MAKRIVSHIPIVLGPEGSEAKLPAPRLVRATTPSVAIAHVAKQTFMAEVAKQDQLVALLGKKTKVEEAGEAS